MVFLLHCSVFIFIKLSRERENFVINEFYINLMCVFDIRRWKLKGNKVKCLMVRFDVSFFFNCSFFFFFTFFHFFITLIYIDVICTTSVVYDLIGRGNVLMNVELFISCNLDGKLCMKHKMRGRSRLYSWDIANGYSQFTNYTMHSP